MTFQSPTSKSEDKGHHKADHQPGSEAKRNWNLGIAPFLEIFLSFSQLHIYIHILTPSLHTFSFEQIFSIFLFL